MPFHARGFEPLTSVLTQRCGADAALQRLLETLATTCIEVAKQLQRSAFRRETATAGTQNSAGDVQKRLDLEADALFETHLAALPGVAALVSEERDNVHWLKEPEEGDFIICFDPLDGSSNIDVGMVVGSIFSVFRLAGDICPDNLLAKLSGNNQLAAGYALYGPVTELVLGMDDWIDGFCYDPQDDSFRRIHPDMTIAADAREIAINAAREPLWPAPIAHFVRESFTPESDGGRGANMRWTASMVADVHRILLRGGVFIYPEDRNRNARLRLVYEANPIALLMRAAGARATNGRDDILDLTVDTLHQKVGVVLGARNAVSNIQTLYEKA
ncbi:MULTISPECIES: class 1 fructose-bisphosphatase [Alphaproteobacteria]|uniref:class 1 fructose-bisphosphatase n=1 Tax=Alphaproteobacteria TaxID=28211 RepID=UPI003A9473A2